MTSIERKAGTDTDCDLCAHPRDGRAYREAHLYIRGQKAVYSVLDTDGNEEGALCDFHAREWDGR